MFSPPSGSVTVEVVTKRVAGGLKTAVFELDALERVRQVDEARRCLSSLKQQTRSSGENQEASAEILRLEKFIAGHSKRAELAITDNYQQRQDLG